MSASVNTSKWEISQFRNKISDFCNEINQSKEDADKARNLLESKINNLSNMIEKSMDNINLDINSAEIVLRSNEAKLNDLRRERADAQTQIQSCQSNVYAMNEAVSQANASTEGASQNKAAATANLKNAQADLSRANSNLNAIENNIDQVENINRNLQALIDNLRQKKNGFICSKRSLEEKKSKLNKQFKAFGETCSYNYESLRSIDNLCGNLSEIIGRAVNDLNISEESNDGKILIENIDDFLRYVQAFDSMKDDIIEKSNTLRMGMFRFKEDFSSALSESSDVVVSEILGSSDAFTDCLSKIRDNLIDAYRELKRYLSAVRY